MSPILYFAMVIIAAGLGWGLVSAINVRREAMNKKRLDKWPFIVFAVASAALMAVLLLAMNIFAGFTAVVSFFAMWVVVAEADRNIGVVSRRLGNNPSGMLSFRIWANPIVFVAIIWVLSCEQIVGWANAYNGFGLALQALIWGYPALAAAVVWRWAKLTDQQQVRSSDQSAQQADQPETDQAFEAIPPENTQAAEAVQAAETTEAVEAEVLDQPIEADAQPADQQAQSTIPPTQPRGRHARPDVQPIGLEDEPIGQTVLPVEGSFPTYKSRYEREFVAAQTV